MLTELDERLEQLLTRIDDAHHRSTRVEDSEREATAVTDSLDGECVLSELCTELAGMLRKPAAKCKHRWVCLRGRVHNRGDGKGKYHAFVCTACGKFQRRYI